MHAVVETSVRPLRRRVSLPVVTESFHREPFFDYQIVRAMAEGHARAEDLRAAAAQVQTPADMVEAFTAQANTAADEARWDNAAFYLRIAEFFTPRGSPEQLQAYRTFLEWFDRGFGDLGFVRHRIAYGDGSLPALHVRGPEPTKGRVVVFGGFDSLIEEFVSIWGSIAAAGYEVVAFDGPGQGGARALYGLPFSHDWEKPVGAVLDHFGFDDVSLVGISMGGYWAIRAAAFEPRVRRVVAWPPVYDWLHQLPRWVRPLVRVMVRFRWFMNVAIRLKMRLAPIMRHAIAQAMYLQGLDLQRGDPPIEAVHWLLGMNEDHLSSARVTADTLLLGGARDTFQPPRLLHAQAAALTSARSVTTRIFTEAEHAAGHVQMGNLGLAVDEVIAWLDRMHEADAPA